MPNDATRVHISDVNSFKSCRRKFEYSSRMRQGLEPRRMYAPFFLGRAIHSALEAYHATGADPQRALDSFVEISIAEMKMVGTKFYDQSEVDEQIELARAMLYTYVSWTKTYKGEYKDSDLKFVAVEKEFDVPIHVLGKPTGIHLAGRFDGVVKHIPTDTLWLWETKTTSTFSTFEDFLDRSEQATAYCLAAEYELGEPIAGVLYNVLRKKAPAVPAINQDGTLSKRKNIDTTAALYLEAVRTQHPDWTRQEIMAVYGDVLNTLLEDGNTFCKRIPIRKTRDELLNFAREFYQVAREMVNPDTPMYRTENPFGCKYCPFKAPCSASKSGGDEYGLLEVGFKPRTMEVHMSAIVEGL